MRYKFFNIVIHQGLKGWGGKRHGVREGLRTVSVWVILKDSVAISATGFISVTQTKSA